MGLEHISVSLLAHSLTHSEHSTCAKLCTKSEELLSDKDWLGPRLNLTLLPKGPLIKTKLGCRANRIVCPQKLAPTTPKPSLGLFCCSVYRVSNFAGLLSTLVMIHELDTLTYKLRIVFFTTNWCFVFFIYSLKYSF